MGGGLLEGWDVEVNISDGQVGDCHEVANHELEGAEVNNALYELQLENPNTN